MTRSHSVTKAQLNDEGCNYEKWLISTENYNYH